MISLTKKGPKAPSRGKYQKHDEEELISKEENTIKSLTKKGLEGENMVLYTK
jgi:hypothetical protein